MPLLNSGRLTKGALKKCDEKNGITDEHMAKLFIALK